MTSERSEFEKWAVTILGENPNWRESGYCELAWQSWQARAALATQPAAGEPVAESAYDVFIDSIVMQPTRKQLGELYREHHAGHPEDFALDVLERWGGRTTTGEPVAHKLVAVQANGEWQEVRGKWVDGAPIAEMLEGVEEGYLRVELAFSAPPAAAHGDEAVRKDAARYQALRNTPEIFIGVAEGDDMVFLKSPDQLDQLADNAAAMRAQGDGGQV